jgi:tetratricopeptide (TPR) repeat protein
MAEDSHENAATAGDQAAETPELRAGEASAGWSPRRFCLMLAIPCGLALLLRLAMLDEFLRENPIAEQPWMDARVYWQMAGRMASGQWTDGQPFLSAPLYPYLLGAIRTAGGSLLAVYVLQLLMHLATAALIAGATRVRFGAGAGILAAILFLALTEPAVSSTRALANTLQLLLVALLWWRWVVLERRGQRWRDIVGVGALIGLFALSYPAALLLVPAYGVWLWVAVGGFWRGLSRAAAGVVSAVLFVLPATIHNLVVGGELIPICANSGINLRLGNGPDSHGIGGKIPELRPQREVMFDDAARIFEQASGRSGTWREIDRHFRDEALRYCRENPLPALRNIGSKLYLFLAARNYDEMMPTVIERQTGFADRAILAPLATPWLMGTALVGLIAVLRRPIRFAPEWLLCLLPLVVVLVFFYTARYRLPAVPLLCALSAYALMYCRRFRLPTLIVIIPFLLPLPLYIANRVMGIDAPDMLRTHFVRALSEAQVWVGNQHAATQDYPEAERRFRSAIKLWEEHALAHQQLGCLYAKQGRLDDAVRELNEAIRLDPIQLPARFHLYNALCIQRRYTDAAATLWQITEFAPGNLRARLGLAWMLATCPDDRVRNGAEALQQAQAAQSLAADNRYDVLDVLAAVHAELGQFEQAVTLGSAAADRARQQGHRDEAVAIQQRVVGYRNRQPCRAQPRVLGAGAPR